MGPKRANWLLSLQRENERTIQQHTSSALISAPQSRAKVKEKINFSMNLILDFISCVICLLPLAGPNLSPLHHLSLVCFQELSVETLSCSNNFSTSNWRQCRASRDAPCLCLFLYCFCLLFASFSPVFRPTFSAQKDTHTNDQVLIIKTNTELEPPRDERPSVSPVGASRQALSLSSLSVSFACFSLSLCLAAAKVWRKLVDDA